MRRFWLIFAQAVTISVAVLFVITTLKPQWFGTAALSGGASPLPSPASARSATTPSFAAAVTKAMPAVVYIYSTRSQARNPQVLPFFDDPLLRRFFGDPKQRNRPQRSFGLGSGVIVSADGVILTNNHVVRDAIEIEVTLNDGRSFPAKVVGRDPETDLAVLHIQHDAPLPSLPFATPDSLQIGDIVLAIGNPFGVGQTATIGIVSALGRNHLGLNTFENYIQTDAAINPGNSGGALVDSAGNLVGINTAIYSRSGDSLGIAFSIPVSLARNVLEQILAHGSVQRGWVGIEISDITPEISTAFVLPDTHGALITGVLANGPAARAGVLPGDVLLEINQQTINSAELTRESIVRLKPGSQTVFHLRRGNQKLSLPLQVDRREVPEH